MNKTIASNKYFKLIEWLKASRVEKELSMRALADKLSKPHSYVQKVESLERKLDIYEYTQYCAALELDPCDGIERFFKKS